MQANQTVLFYDNALPPSDSYASFEDSSRKPETPKKERANILTFTYIHNRHCTPIAPIHCQTQTRMILNFSFRWRQINCRYFKKERQRNQYSISQPDSAFVPSSAGPFTFQTTKFSAENIWWINTITVRSKGVISVLWMPIQWLLRLALSVSLALVSYQQKSMTERNKPFGHQFKKFQRSMHLTLPEDRRCSGPSKLSKS